MLKIWWKHQSVSAVCVTVQMVGCEQIGWTEENAIQGKNLISHSLSTTLATWPWHYCSGLPERKFFQRLESFGFSTCFGGRWCVTPILFRAWTSHSPGLHNSADGVVATPSCPCGSFWRQRETRVSLLLFSFFTWICHAISISFKYDRVGYLSKTKEWFEIID